MEGKAGALKVLPFFFNCIMTFRLSIFYSSSDRKLFWFDWCGSLPTPGHSVAPWNTTSLFCFKFWVIWILFKCPILFIVSEGLPQFNSLALECGSQCWDCIFSLRPLTLIALQRPENLSAPRSQNPTAKWISMAMVLWQKEGPGC